ncbi:MAG: sensor histidine kinase [Lachnospiraceae bacterium]|jgi:signal transduction histidine kinase
MKRKKYMKDRLFAVMLRCLFVVMSLALMVLFDTPYALQIIFFVLYVLTEGILFAWDYIRRKKFYDTLFFHLGELDKKFLILETLEEPSFYDGQLLYEVLYDVDKSMCENVKQFQQSVVDFKEYIEMWIHEVKIPLASLRLMCHNHKQEMDRKYVEQLRRIDDYTEQVLYYVRSEHTEKDFLIKETKLDKLVTRAVVKQKDDLLAYHIELQVEPGNALVMTDGKWLEFILNQIMNNAIKYRDLKKASRIVITAEDLADKTVLHIKDNGIGIAKSDLGRVFEKSFTGENGRQRAKSTGMGLYIAKKLCERLGHGLDIESQQGEYTMVSISFGKNDYYKM